MIVQYFKSEGMWGIRYCTEYIGIVLDIGLHLNECEWFVPGTIEDF